VNRQQNQRARRAIKKLNEIRHKQEMKIDILCNDIVGAHSQIISQLQALNFRAGFYESILTQKELGGLLDTSSKLIQEHIPNSKVAVFLLSQDGFEMHMADNDEPIDVDKVQFEKCFTLEVISDICRSNDVCSLDDMFEMGLCCNDVELNKLSAAAIPLGQFGRGVGFVLIYRSAKNKLRAEELGDLKVITPGLYRAIESFREVSSQGNKIDQAI
jgi:hypothetical protein